MNNAMKKLFPTFAFLLASAVVGLAQDKPLLLQKPALSKTHIAFTFAGDLWIVPREGGSRFRQRLRQLSFSPRGNAGRMVCVILSAKGEIV